MSVKPIKPEDVFEERKKNIPEEVFEAFNELIVKEFSSGHSTIRQSDVADLIVKKMNDKLKAEGKEAIFTSRFLYDNHFLDIEDVYREAGWKVEYDKPAYNEDYPATFKFSRP